MSTSDRRAERAARIYARLLRLYPAAQQRAFGQQMLQTFQDHFRDAVELQGGAERGLLHSRSGSVAYFLSAALERPTNQFLSAFTQATDAIAADELAVYHLGSARVEISTLPLGLGLGGTPAVLLDGEPAARPATDVRVVDGRLPVPRADVLEVVVTPATASTRARPTTRTGSPRACSAPGSWPCSWWAAWSPACGPSRAGWRSASPR